MSSVLVLGLRDKYVHARMFGTGTGKGLARALSLTASARKMQNRHRDKPTLEAGKWRGGPPDCRGGSLPFRCWGSGRHV